MERTPVFEQRIRTNVHWLSGANIIAGIWLIVAPFALAYTDTTSALWNDIIVGAVVLIFAAVRVGMPLHMQWLSWINALLGVWLFIAPFALGYSDISSPLWNDIVLGVIVAVLAVASSVASVSSMRR